MNVKLIAVGLGLALALFACGSRAHVDHAKPTAGPVQTVASNVLRADYAGSKECAYCHQKIYDSWTRSPMHRMTLVTDADAIRAPFDGTTFRFKGDDVTMLTQDGQRFMHLHSRKQGEHLYRVTKRIGGRYREDYVGIDVTNAKDPATDPGRGSEKILPATWVYATQSWRYKGYSVMVPERDGLGAGPVWRQQCIFCHNTVPYLSIALDDLMGPSAPGYQGKNTDRLIPEEKKWIVRSRDRDGLFAALSDELAYLGAPRPDSKKTTLAGALDLTIKATRAGFDQQDFVEVGIGCEMCHLGSKQHADDPKWRPSLEPVSPLLYAGPQHARKPSEAEKINHVCLRCHTVLFSGYPWTWEGGGNRDATAGGSTINSGEARDFQLGGCAKDLSCTTCHDPHGEDSKSTLDGQATIAGNQICVKCHTQYTGDDAVAKHTHHDPKGEGSVCMDCHMPRKNMSLTYGLSRYHRIGSPTDAQRVEKDRPLECAICHDDKSVETIVSTMEKWWGKTYDRAALRALYGDDLSVNAMAATLARGKAHEQAVPIVIFGQRKERAHAREIARELTNTYPLVRLFAKHALETIAGAPMTGVDLDGTAEEIKSAAGAWLDANGL
jgi:predicted CXXCH cytochrome family protein